MEDEAANINETQVVYLISTILDILGDQTVSEDFSEVCTQTLLYMHRVVFDLHILQVFIGIAGWLTAAVRSRVDLPPTLPPSSTPLPSSQDGSILLKNLDQFALNNHNPIYDDVITDYIGVPAVVCLYLHMSVYVCVVFSRTHCEEWQWGGCRGGGDGD